METILDKLKEINNIRSIEQSMSWAKKLEENFYNRLKNHEIEVKKVEPNPELNKQQAKQAVQDYLNSYRETAAEVDENEVSNYEQQDYTQSNKNDIER